MGSTTKVYTDPEHGFEVQERDGVVLASHALHDAIAALEDMLEHAPHNEDDPRPLFDAACDKAAAALIVAKVRWLASGGQAAEPAPAAQLPIPVSAGKRIADEFGYDQVVIVGRRVGGFEHVTTYGRDAAHCSVAARMGHFFKHKLMGWPEPDSLLDEAQRIVTRLEGMAIHPSHYLGLTRAIAKATGSAA